MRARISLILISYYDDQSYGLVDIMSWFGVTPVTIKLYLGDTFFVSKHFILKFAVTLTFALKVIQLFFNYEGDFG